MIVRLLWVAVLMVSAVSATNTTDDTLALRREFSGAAAPSVVDADVVENMDFESPYYSQPRDFMSIRGTAVAAVFVSMICGHASTAALATRPMAIMNACKPPIADLQTVSQLPLSFSLTDSDLGHYLANAALNGPLLVGVAILGVLVSVFLKFVSTKPLYYSAALLRFPGFLGAPAIYLGNQAITAAMTLFTTSTSTSGEMIAGFVAVAFFGALIPLHLLLVIRFLPMYAKYALDFRSVSGTAYAQRRLAEVVFQFNEKLKDEEAKTKEKEQEKQRMEERMSSVGEGLEGLDYPPENTISGLRHSAAFSAVMSSAGLLTSAAKAFVSNMFASDSGLFSWSEAEGLDEERIRQVRNATFSSLLEEELRATDEEDTAFSLIITGSDRWEDMAEGDIDLNPEALEIIGYTRERGVLVCNRNPAKQKLEVEDVERHTKERTLAGPPIRNGFVRMFGILFERYRLGCHWFLSLEMFISFSCGVLTGWRPSDGTSDACYPQAALILVLMTTYLVALVVVRPYISRFEGALNLLFAFVIFIASILFIMGLSAGNWAHVGSYLLAVMCVYILILKALLDLYDTVFQHVHKIKQPWAPIEELTQHYMDLDREVSRGKTLTQNIIALRTDDDDRLLETVEDSDDDLSDDMFGTTHSRKTLGSTAVTVVSRQVNEEDEGLYHQIGGRHKAFVTSRGVPLSLLPFKMDPIPDRHPLPPRSFNPEDKLRLFERQLLREAKKRRLAQQLLLIGEGAGDLITLMGMDQADLEYAVEQAKKVKQRSDEVKGFKGNIASRMGDVAEMLEKEYKRNEEKDELRRSAIRATMGITDEGKVQAMLEDGKFYDDEPVDFTSLLLATYDCDKPDPRVLRRSQRSGLRPAVPPTPSSSPSSPARYVQRPEAASSSPQRSGADVASEVLRNLYNARKKVGAAQKPAAVQQKQTKPPSNLEWEL